MGFLRRLFSAGEDDGSAGAGAARPDEAPLEDRAALEDEERARELEMARFEQARVDDLVRRQQRFADRSWTPPAQGGERRADDGDATQP